ncbi:MAG: helix-turn-helix transcriptional regulator [Planctomycetes bacterium]|nr:helix-turn-helix transcriptional regulator [Planctomycetota bacterium]
MSKRRKKLDLAEQLRGAFRDSGMSRYMLAKRAGVSYAVVHRFVAAERDITLATATRICDVLGLELKPAPSGARKGR